MLINRTVWAVRRLVSRPGVAARLHPRAAMMLPPAAGLALIPLAVHHIDEGVTRWMDVHLRPHLPQVSDGPLGVGWGGSCLVAFVSV